MTSTKTILDNTALILMEIAMQPIKTEYQSPSTARRRVARPGLHLDISFAAEFHIPVKLASVSVLTDITDEVVSRSKPKSIPVFEANLIIDNLYLGSCSNTDPDLLRLHNIKYVLNVSHTKTSLPDDFVCEQIPISDKSDVKIRDYFERSFKFIDAAITNGPILVHCRAGISRSATIVIAYLMKKQHMSYQTAMEFVSKRREIICPNIGFCQHLEEYEAELGGT